MVVRKVGTIIILQKNHIETQLHHIITEKVMASPHVNAVAEEGLFDEYLRFHIEYTEKYAPTKVLCFMAVGSFYECYSYQENGNNLAEISQMINVRLTSKKMKFAKLPIVADMLGVPCETVNKFIETLIENQYTVIIIDQFDNPDVNAKTKRMLRKVTHVVTPSTFIETNAVTANNLMVIYVETNKNISSTKNNYSMGLSVINTVTCSVEHKEEHASYEADGIIDGFNQMYHQFRPSELIIYEINNTKNAKNADIVTNRISSTLTPNQVVFKYDSIDACFGKISYQNAVLSKIYGETMLSQIVEHDLANSPYSIIALTIAFDYIHKHSPALLKDLKPPTQYDSHNNMVMFNHAQYQLNIVDYNKHSIRQKSLTTLMNNCLTSMGKRELVTRLSSPFINTDTINNLYRLTDLLLEENRYASIRQHLCEIDDIERCFRKICVEKSLPSDVQKLAKSFDAIWDLIQYFTGEPVLKLELAKFGFTDAIITQFTTATNWISQTFLLDELCNDIVEKTNECYFVTGKHADIDKLIENIDENQLLMDFAKAIQKLTGEECDIKNTRGKYYLQTSKMKGKAIEKIVKTHIQPVAINEFTTINLTELDFEYLTNTVKISHASLNGFSNTVMDMIKQLNKLCKKHFLVDVFQWYETNKAVFAKCCKFITTIDYVCNNAYNAIRFRYTKPKIVADKTGYVSCKEIRHPIIERMEKGGMKSEYVTNDFLIDETKCGNIIYGINSAGKSSFIKAIALNVVLAQCGLFVPAKQFDYSIVTKLFTRISSDDNIYDGESSFVVEAKQIASIQRSATANSLIIADEMCKSTDYMSALCMVLATTINLCKKKAPFLFASHLHEIPEYDDVKKLNNIAFYHVRIQPTADCIQFERKIQNGVLENNNGYGIMIAKYIMNDANYIEQCLQIKEGLMREKGKAHNSLVGTKVSRYNANVFMDCCMACETKENLETHHLITQEDYKKKKNIKFHIAKDDACNLCILCQSCHDGIDTGKVIVDGFTETSKGRMLKISTK
jgi:DNA mismatch repair protein MutS